MKAKFPLRFLSYLLSFTMLFSLMDFTAFAADDDSIASDGGFTLNLKWNGADQDPNTFSYDSQYEETRLVRLKVSYYNEAVVNSYRMGQIIISVPGVKDAVRSGESYIPVALAADKASDTTKQYDWSYTYSSSSDTFTFTNNFEVDENASFEGSFEIIWELSSRDTIHDFTKDFQAKLRTGKNEQVTSNTISYSQTRKRDEYTLSMSSEKLYSDEGFDSVIPAGSNVEDYHWVRYNVHGTDTYYARDVEGAERFDFYIPQGAVLTGANFIRSGKTEIIDGLTYDIWTVKKDISKYTASPYLRNVYVGYPLTLKDNTPFDIRVDIVGKYYDENTETILAQGFHTIDSLDEKYLHWNNEIYNIAIVNHGTYSNYISNHCYYCDRFGAVNAAHMAAGSQKYNSSLSTYLFYDKYVETSGDTHAFDFELIDDYIDVYTTSGDKRQLSDDEYNFTSVTIPAAYNITNINDVTITPNKYGVEVYVRRAGEVNFDADPIVTTKITESYQNITLPDDSVSVKLVVTGIQESLRPIDFNINYKFHTTADDIDYNGGSIINNVCIRLFNHDTGEWVDEGAFTKDHYYFDSDYERDIRDYGYAMLRASDEIHVLEIPNEYSSNTYLSSDGSNSESFFFIGSVDVNFTIPEENSLSNFSIYTILPEDMRLQQLYSNELDLLEALTFSCDDYTSDYIREHAVITKIDNDYHGSGRTYIAISFDFSDAPVRISFLSVQNFPFRVDRDKISNTTRSFTFRTITLIDQSGKWYAPYRDNYYYDDNLWKDIDNDGDANEYAAISQRSATVYNPQNSNIQFNKSISTTLTNGYVQPVVNSNGTGYESDSMPTAYRGLTYSYKLRFRTGESIAGNIILADNLEAGDLSEWQGTLQRVDTTYAEELLGKKPTVYYSSNRANLRVRPDLTDTSVWSTTMPDTVRAVAIDFGDSKVLAGKILSVEIYLSAPTSTEFEERITENASVAFYDKFNEAGKVIGSSLINSNTAAATLVPFMGTIKVTKTDDFSGDKLQNAVFSLYRMNGNRPDSDKDELVTDSLTTNDSGNASIRVKYGKYYLVEKTAPIGYELDETPQFVTLDDVKPDISVTVNITNQRKSGKMLVYKISDRNNELFLEGAEFSVYNEKDELVQEKLVTDENGELTIDGLPWGKYYLLETKAPDGFELSNEKTEFTVSADNDAGRLDSVTVEDKQIPATAILVKHEMLEDGTTVTDVPLDGAAYELHSSGGALLGTYMTDDNGKIYVDDLDFGSYYFIETIAAQGYEKFTEKIEFSIDGTDLQKDGTVSKTIQTSDKRLLGRVWLQKTDEVGDYVRNADYALFNKDGNQIDETGELSRKTFTTNAEGIFEINGLYWGDYYLQEVASPTGYELNSTKYNFTVGRTTVNNTILFRVTDDRSKGSVELTKVDADDLTDVLEGAVYTLYMNNGTVYKDDLVTDENGKILVENLPWGTYYFLEKVPPENFSLSDEKIRFSINYLSAGKTQSITATDTQTVGDVTVIKKIAIDEIILAHGAPYFTFKLTGKDSDGVDRTCFKRVAFNEDYVKALLESGETEAELSFTFTNLGAGTWTVTEESTSRYRLSKAEALTENGVSDGTKVEFTFDDDFGFSGTAKFVNEKTVQSSTSHTDSVVNLLKKTRLITGISSIWTGGNLTETTINRDNVAVFVSYDDGTETRLDNDEYTLSQEEFDIGISATYVIDVTYTDPSTSISYMDSFSIDVNTPMPFTWTVEEGVIVVDGEAYDGKATITGYTGDSSVMNIPSSVVGIRSLVDRGDNQSTGAYTYTDNGKHYLVTGTVGETTDDGNLPLYGMDDVESVIFPDNLLVIGAYSFVGCDQISLGDKLPSKLSVIGESAFDDCLGLSGGLEIPASVKEIDENAFRNCKNLTGEVKINGGNIGKSAFVDCSGISKLTLGENVTSIGQGAFNGCGNISNTLTIPASVIYIGKNAFGNADRNKACSKLAGLNFEGDSNLIDIDEYAFANCTSMKGSLTIPESVNTIGKNAFYNCSGFSGTLTVKSGALDAHSFAMCSGFNKLILEEGVTTIGDYAFNGCSGLSGTLNIPSTVTLIGNLAFGGFSQNTACSRLTGLTFADNSQLETIGSSAFSYCTQISGELNLPDGLVNIRDNAFRNCQSLTSLSIPATTTTLGNAVFSYCTSLKDAVIPDTVSHMGHSMFYGCYSLKTATLPNNIKTIPYSTFRDCYSLLDSIQIPESVTTIGSYAFYNCSAFKDFTVPNTVKSIDAYAFSGCSNMKTITLPDTLTRISDCVFLSCSSLNDVTLPDTIESIGQYAFEYCSSLKQIDIPEGVTSIDYGAFYCCSNLADISFPSTLTYLGAYVFYNCDSLVTVELPDSLQNIEYCTFYSCDKLQTVILPDNLRSIGGEAFRSCVSLQNIDFPSSLTQISYSAFYDCDSLTSIELPDNLSCIDQEVFENCDNLTSVKLPSRLNSIGYEAFRDCPKLTDLVFPSTLTFIDRYAFYNCDGLTSLDLQEGSVSSISEYAFCDCDNLVTVKLPNGLTTIGNYAFYYCYKLVSVEFPDTLTALGSWAFANCYALTSVELPDGIKRLEERTFNYCTGLSNLKLPSSLEYIGGSAFSYCTALTSVEIPDGVERIESSAFYRCTGLSDLKLSSSLEYIGYNAFYNCYNLNGRLALPDNVGYIGDQAFYNCNRLESIIVNDNVTSIGSNAFYQIPILCYHGNLSGGRWGAWDWCQNHEVTLVETLKEPTCTENGLGKYKCYADVEYQRELPKLPHSFDENDICTGCGLECFVRVTNTSNGSYKFVQDGTKWTSNNKGISSSTARSEWKISTKADYDYTFFYYVSSEANYDKLTITVDGSTVVNNLSGTGYSERSYAVHLTEGTHTITAQYSKDGSVNNGDDCGYIILPEEVNTDNDIEEPVSVSVTNISNFRYKFVQDGTKWTSNNNGVGGSTASSEWQITIDKDSDYTFFYYVSSESYYDKLTITLDGDIVVENLSGTGYSEQTYVVHLTEGAHTITAQYKKDGSTDNGDDLGYIILPEEIRTVNSMSIANISTGTHRFAQDGTKWTSNNQGVHNSTAYSQWRINMPTDSNYTFFYFVSSESGCDRLTITVDGSTVVNNLSGTGYSEQSYVVHLTEGVHTITAQYYKDGSVNRGSDCGYIILPA